MIKRYQYKANTQTLLVPTSIDKWLGTSPDIRFNKPTLLESIRSSYFSFINYASYYVEILTLDKWSPRLPDKRYNKPEILAAIQSGSFSFLRPLITSDKWKASYDDIITVSPKTLSYAIRAGASFLPALQPPEAPAHARDYLGHRGRNRAWVVNVSSGTLFGE
jgi:hypothetical protein